MVDWRIAQSNQNYWTLRYHSHNLANCFGSGPVAVNWAESVCSLDSQLDMVETDWLSNSS